MYPHRGLKNIDRYQWDHELWMHLETCRENALDKTLPGKNPIRDADHNLQLHSNINKKRTRRIALRTLCATAGIPYKQNCTGEKHKK